ncbi:MAG: RidA family protein [Rhizobiales bacterium]|nr:RidA family protein [Hyphomicrobiales bacterium]MBO6698545.1 RidA family protein [Hyphomicrobiales bacterium]MBO6735201.1 RidA family protein [Hyphomicrobiales bacterium]MBO6910991.1 RidA family protein [Hyphomicrobiales bacterium]MBO6957216.1 RidA family protein [Hyphomicrobiales bacterium]
MATRKVIIPPGMENIYDSYHYAPAIQVGDTLYLSGQVGRDENLNVVEGIEEQYAQAFENVGKVLDAASATFDDVVELETWFAEDMGNLKIFMAVKDRYFTNRYPTWTGFAVKGFSMPGIIVEIKCKAVLGLADE